MPPNKLASLLLNFSSDVRETELMLAVEERKARSLDAARKRKEAEADKLQRSSSYTQRSTAATAANVTQAEGHDKGFPGFSTLPRMRPLDKTPDQTVFNGDHLEAFLMEAEEAKQKKKTRRKRSSLQQNKKLLDN